MTRTELKADVKLAIEDSLPKVFVMNNLISICKATDAVLKKIEQSCYIVDHETDFEIETEEEEQERLKHEAE